MNRQLMTRAEVAAMLGISPDSVRNTLARAGITEERGYPRERVERLAERRPMRGYRTDLHGPADHSPTPTEET
jgi:hypothetical protein